MIDPGGDICTCGAKGRHATNDHDEIIERKVKTELRGYAITFGGNDTCTCGMPIGNVKESFPIHNLFSHDSTIHHKLKEEYENRYFNELDKAVTRIGREMDLRLQAFQGACRVAGVAWKVHAEEMYSWLMRADIKLLKLEDK